MELDYGLIGKRIKLARRDQEMTQEVLAEKTSLSPTHISYIENGHTKLSVQSLVDIANTLEVSTDWLLHGNLTSHYDEIANMLIDCSDRDVEKLVELLRVAKNIFI